MKQTGIVMARVLALAAGFLVGFFTYSYGPLQNVRISAQAPFIIRNSQPGIPRQLIIPALSIYQNIEPVGLATDKRMDVPTDVYNAGWYKFGIRPGEYGSAVIDGHVNTPQLTPSIFAKLDTLKAGDIVSVRDDTGRTWDFIVTRIGQLPDQDFPVGAVFGPANKPRLNLITCSGTWDRKLKSFTRRTVVFTELAS